MTEPQITADQAPEFDPETIEAGRVLFAGACDFVRGVVSIDQMPDTDLPEIAFAGRSNVGKSSLINALTNRKTLARTSNTPGRTREINFFNLADRLMLADLPGYGYARVPKAQVEVWTRLVNTYLRGRPCLRRACVLIDARHGVKESDTQVMKMLDAAAVSYQIILTKSDKVKVVDLENCLDRTKTLLRTHVAAHPQVHVTSSEKGDGIAELRAALGELAAPRAG
ncbi:MAG: ribosome biogenesis GTP-binding protein YihA/YsxC [Alphaproteobacteria bacterium]|nr:ribosome biogenesis GTP-binding protein YihA/YsxC [Alphaproteobacteria bacterium]